MLIDHGVEDVQNEVCSVFYSPMGAKDDLFDLLQPTGVGSKMLTVPSCSSFCLTA